MMTDLFKENGHNFHSCSPKLKSWLFIIIYHENRTRNTQ